MIVKKFFSLPFFILPFAGFSQTILKVGAGTSIKMSSASEIILDNTNLVNDGNISLTTGDGSFRFTGNMNTDISGTNKPVFDKIIVAKTSNSQLALQTNVDAFGVVQFNSGLLNLNGYELNLGATGLLQNENETSHAVGSTGGYIQWSDVLNAPASIDPGNLGIIISSSQNLGATTVRRGHQSQTISIGASILRYFDIIPTNNSSLNATLQLNYFDAELNGQTESTLNIWKSSDLINWSYIGFDGRDASANYVNRSGVQDFSRWTLSSSIGTALPVEFGLFNTNCNGNTVTVKWITETEINSSRFEIQKSDDGRNWLIVSSLPAAGYSADSKQYSFTDNAIAQNAFYRVAEFDWDGRVVYTPVSRINCGKQSDFKLWPNPAINHAWVSINVTSDANADLKIIDQKGAVVNSKKVEMFAGNNIFDIDTHLLSSGNYLVQLTYNGENKTIKMIKQ